MIRQISLLLVMILFWVSADAQLRWENVDAEFQPLPPSVHVYRSNTPIDGKANIAYYVEADAHSKKTLFGVDTSRGRRLTPSEFYAKSKPLVVVNGTFFSYATNQSLNVVIKDGKLVGYNIHTMNGRGKDTFTYRHPVGGALGISRRGKMDVAWLVTDSTRRYPMASQLPLIAFKDSMERTDLGYILHSAKGIKVSKWKMRTAIGGGPVLLQDGEIKISNNEELRFGGKAIEDKHPRSAIGYTKSGKLIILVVQGRFPNIAEGATLTQEAQIFKDLGCWEALNLDGGGSTCMLVNGKETIKVSDKEGQRPVPSVFTIHNR